MEEYQEYEIVQEFMEAEEDFMDDDYDKYVQSLEFADVGEEEGMLAAMGSGEVKIENVYRPPGILMPDHNLPTRDVVELGRLLVYPDVAIDQYLSRVELVLYSQHFHPTQRTQCNNNTSHSPTGNSIQKHKQSTTRLRSPSITPLLLRILLDKTHHGRSGRTPLPHRLSRAPPLSTRHGLCDTSPRHILLKGTGGERQSVLYREVDGGGRSQFRLHDLQIRHEFVLGYG
jgi:hypothetical protein